MRKFHELRTDNKYNFTSTIDIRGVEGSEFHTNQKKLKLLKQALLQ